MERIEMIMKCLTCNKFYDDEFRTTSCSHDTFLANDGQNNFEKHEKSWLSDSFPIGDYYKAKIK